MNVFEKMVNTQALLFIYMAIGFVLCKVKIITDKSRGSLVSLLMDLVLPCMIIDSFNQSVSPGELASAAIVLGVSAGACFAAYAVGKLIWRHKPDARKSTLLFGTMFSNAGNAGIPVVSLVFGDVGVVYASFFLIPVRVLLWTMGTSLYVPGSGRQKLCKLLLNPSLISIFIGLLLMLAPFSLPPVLDTAVANIGDMTAPLAMFIIGASFAGLKPSDMLDRDVFELCAMRLIVIPLLALGVLKLCNVETLLMQVTVILLSMPVASTTAIIAERYGADYRFASKCVCISTLLSLLTVPLISALL